LFLTNHALPRVFFPGQHPYHTRTTPLITLFLALPCFSLPQLQSFGGIIIIID